MKKLIIILILLILLVGYVFINWNFGPRVKNPEAAARAIKYSQSLKQ